MSNVGCFILTAILLVLLVLAYRSAELARPAGFHGVMRVWQECAGEASKLRRSTSGKVRSKLDWGAGLPAFLESLGANDGWIGAWAQDGSWDNYPLIVDGQVVGEAAQFCPITCRALQGVRGVTVAGFSRVRAGGSIEPHTDACAGKSHGRAALHLCLTGPSKSDQGASTLTVGRRKYRQLPGTVIVFDPEVIHSVTNTSNMDRVLLYINFEYASRRN